MFKYLTYIAILFSFTSCSNEDEAIIEDLDENKTLEVPQPDYFPDIVYDIDENPPTEKGFELGKKLFYDGKLSSSGVISCGFCHMQEFAFTHHTHRVSHGVGGALGNRNAQPLQNLAFKNNFNWDGAAAHLDAQFIIPITTDAEMNENISNVLDKLKAEPTYQEMFDVAFEDGEINTKNFFDALAQFLVMMVSSETKYDHVVHDGTANFTPEESAGKTLFNSKCSTCHSGELLTNQQFMNNGLPINPQYDDIGRARITGLTEDKYKFQVPSLRNVELTLPYMHDGRFDTLRDVLDFYDAGVQETPNISSEMYQDNDNPGIPLTEDEKDKIIAFLKTLSDIDFTLDDRFSEF
jgi:cytochrome c peroxidase